MSEVSEKKLLPTAAKVEKLEQMNDLDIRDVIPMLFAYMNERGYTHNYSYENGFVFKNGVRISQLAVDEERNKLHDFSKKKEDFSGRVSYFIPRFIKHVISE